MQQVELVFPDEIAEGGPCGKGGINECEESSADYVGIYKRQCANLKSYLWIQHPSFDFYLHMLLKFNNMQAPLSNNGPLPKDLKVLQVCKMLRALPVKLTPKQFMLHYLTSSNSELAFLRRFWTH
jgi:hypothetical protein